MITGCGRCGSAKGVSKEVVVYGRLYRNLRFMTLVERARNIEQGWAPAKKEKLHLVVPLFSFLLSILPGASHPLYLFLDWVKHIHSREVYTEARRRETARASISNSLLLRFYSLYAYAGFRGAICVLIATIPRGITTGVLNWMYFCASYIHIYMHIYKIYICAMSHCVIRCVLQRFFAYKHSI